MKTALCCAFRAVSPSTCSDIGTVNPFVSYAQNGIRVRRQTRPHGVGYSSVSPWRRWTTIALKNRTCHTYHDYHRERCLYVFLDMAVSRGLSHRTYTISSLQIRTFTSLGILCTVIISHLLLHSAHLSHACIQLSHIPSQSIYRDSCTLVSYPLGLRVPRASSSLSFQVDPVK